MLHYYRVAAEIVEICTGAAHVWALLQNLAKPLEIRKTQKSETVSDLFSAVEKDERESRIRQLEQSSDQVMHEKLKSRLLHLSGFAVGSNDFQETLRSFLAGLNETSNEV